MSENLGIFGEINKKLNETKQEDNDVDQKWQQRNEQFRAKSSIEEVRSDYVGEEENIRKNKRDQIFHNRRLQQTRKVENVITLKQKLTVPIELYEKCNELRPNANDLDSYVNQFKSEDIQHQYIGLVGIRKILSLANDPPIQEVIDRGLVYDFIKYLEHTLPEFQFEALWCLTNIASGTSEHTNSIINKGGIQKIIALIDHPVTEIQEQAIWAIGNIAGDSVKVRDRVIQFGGLEKVIKYLNTGERETLVKQCVWSISNFCRSKPAPDYDFIKPCIDKVIGALYKYDDNEFIVDACWILSYLTESYKKSIKKIIDTNALPKILSFLE
jgi:importin subunit alpha-1